MWKEIEPGLGIFVGGLGLIPGVPPPAGYALMALGLVLIVRGAWQNWFQAPTPDYDVWDAKDAFRLYEAASLWVNVEPRLPLTRKARAQYKVFESALNGGGMPAAASPTVRDAIDRAFAKVNKEEWVDPNTLIDRGVLIEWATHHSEEPPFLFPKRRV